MATHALPDDMPAGHDRRLWWTPILLGLAAIAVGAAALAWPDATIRVVGLLFGLNLFITGLTRAGLCLMVPWYPTLYRVLGVVFGVLSAIVGIICMRNVFASAVLLVVFVAVGWLLDGIIEIAGGVLSPDDPVRVWRIASGLLYLVAATVVLIWPALSLRTFLIVGAVALVAIGVAQGAVSIGLARAARTADRPLAGGVS